MNFEANDNVLVYEPVLICLSNKIPYICEHSISLFHLSLSDTWIL